MNIQLLMKYYIKIVRLQLEKSCSSLHILSLVTLHTIQRLSYISTPKHQPYLYHSIVDIVRKSAGLHPDKEILIHRRPNGGRLSITYEVLDRKSTILAKHLYHIGVRKGQCVCIVGPNTLEWAIGELAILKVGAVSVHLTIGASDAQDAMDVIEKTNCRCILMDPGVEMAMTTPLLTLQTRINQWNEIQQENRIQTLLLRFCEGLSSPPYLENILETGSTSFEFPFINPENTAAIFCTSGSTGRPKLVQISHFSLINISLASMESAPVVMFYNDRPFGWIGGSPIGDIACGIPRLFTDSSSISKDGFSSYVWNSIKQEQCKLAVLVPYLLSDIHDYKSRNPEDTYQLKSVITFGEQVNEIAKRVLESICTDSLIIGYGLTESVAGTFKTIKPETLFIRGDVGCCEPGVEIKIVAENGDTNIQGIVGEICIRSNLISLGYLNEPEMNSELFCAGGWMRTGDIGKINENGNLIILGKIKTVISRGTRKIMPAMIEGVIGKIPGIKTVAVIPVPDKRLNEEVCVCFIAENESDIDEEKMKLLCKDLFFNSETVDGFGEAPAYFVKLCEFPLLGNGKVDRLKLQEISLSVLGIEAEDKS